MEITESKRKRKKSSVGSGDQQEETEEAEMQIFFALVDNIREARLRLMNGSNVVTSSAAAKEHNDDYCSNQKKKEKKLMIEEDGEKDQKVKEKQMLISSAAAVWNPALVFQTSQDLREEPQYKIPTSQISRGGDKGKSKVCNLDLTLSL